MTSKPQEWTTFDARLNPITCIPYDKISYYETANDVYLVSTNRVGKDYRLIKLKKDNVRLNAFVDTYVYSESEIRDIIRNLTHAKSFTFGKARGMLGVVRFTKGYHLILITKRKQIARIGCHRIYEVQDTHMISLCEEQSRGLMSRRDDDDAFRDQFKSFDLKRYFYYSHTYDLTNTLQTNMTTRQMTNKCFRGKYAWNEQLLEPFVRDTQTPSGPVMSESETNDIRSVEDFGHWAPWIVRVVHGSITQAPITIGSKNFTLTLIGRSSVNFAGMRYLKRGVNDLGHVANHVEVEQVVCATHTLSSCDVAGRFSAFVQVRGSVPLHWYHPVVNRPKPPIALAGCDVSYEATKLHFQELISDHGAPVVVINLLKARERHNREGTLTQEYQRAIGSITKDMDKDDPKVVYRAYDLRNGASTAWNEMIGIAERDVDPVGYFACDTSRVKLQCGVARTNCVDCIDRTNLGQFFVGLNAMAHMLTDVGAINSAGALCKMPDIMGLLLNMYLMLGDAISIQYGGSAQVGAGLLDRGIGWDKLMGIQRLYNNFVVDKDKQMVSNLFLRLYEPCPLNQFHREMMLSPYNAQQRTALNRLLRTKEPEVPENRVIDMNELDSDYYLHVPSAPRLVREFPTKWWEEPLKQFYDRSDLTRIYDRRCKSMSSNESFAALGQDGCVHLVSQEKFTEQINEVWYTMHDLNIHDSESDDEAERPLGSVHIEKQPSIEEKPYQNILHTIGKPEGAGCDAYVAHEDAELLPKVPDRPEEQEEIYHDHQSYPYIVLSSSHYRDRLELEGTEQAGSFAHEPALVPHMIPLGDPRDWVNADVVEAMKIINVDGNYDKVIRAVRDSSLTMASLYRMRRETLDVTFEDLTFRDEGRESFSQTIRRFVDLVFRHFPFTDEGAIQAYHYMVGVDTNGLPPPASETISHPEDVCDLLRKFVLFDVEPNTVEAALRTIVNAMIDETGVPRTTKVRFVEGSAARIPDPVILHNVFFARDIVEWLYTNSKRLNLRFHLKAKDSSQNKALYASFLRMLVRGGVIRSVDAQTKARRGLFALPVFLSEVDNGSKLFTFVALAQKVMLNDPAPDGKLEAKFLSPVTQKHMLDAATMAESIASQCFSQLLVFEEGYSNPAGFVNTSHLLTSLEGIVENLATVDIGVLGDEGRKCFFINIFNCLYIHAWIKCVTGEEMITFVVMQQTQHYNIGGTPFSLADIKHGILRRNLCEPRMILPQFAADDPRGAYMIAESDFNYRIMFALIDGYLVPDNLHEILPFDPRVPEMDAGSFLMVGHSDTSLPRPSSPNLTSTPVLRNAAEDSADGRAHRADSTLARTQHVDPYGRRMYTPSASLLDPDEDFDMADLYSDEDTPPPTPAPDSTKGARKHAPSMATTGAGGLLHWLIGGSKKVTVTNHHCRPMFPASVDETLMEIEVAFLTTMMDSEHPQIIIGQNAFPRLCQAFIGTSEFGWSAEEVTKVFSRLWRKHRKQNFGLYSSMNSQANIDRHHHHNSSSGPYGSFSSGNNSRMPSPQA